MDRKKIKEQRKKGYFIKATKNIINEEGVSNLTVKKVAELAGFAPGTLYNYFIDFNDLLSHCATDYWMECKKHVLDQLKEDSRAKKRIINAGKAYCSYFMNNPQVYQLLFIEDIGEISEETPDVVNILIEQLKKGVEEGLIAKKDLQVVENLLGNAIHGLLLFYNKKRSKASKEEVLRIFEDEVKYLLESD